VKRDQTIVLVIIGVVVIFAISRRVVTSTTLLLIGVAIPSIILHEVSHGVVALVFGDTTAKEAGRLTLNPIRHVDLFGTILLPAMLALSGLGIFGYAKPVPVNPSKMRHPRDDAVFTSLAGPATNVLLAVLAALWLRRLHPMFLALNGGPWRLRIPYALGIVNVVLAIFNLIPIPPVDGSAVVARFMPKSWASGWNALSKYGLLILIGILLLAPTALGHVFLPAVHLWQRLLR
jgi:Zn-dependent protease